MHDFLLAKEIVDEVLRIVKEKNLPNIKSVTLEIGGVAVPNGHVHDGLDQEHFEELNLENVKFGLDGIVRNTVLQNVEFRIKKTEGDSWKIVDIEV